MSTHVRRARAALVALAAATFLTIITPLPASAHSGIASSTPAAGSTIAELPAEFSVTMNEPLLASAGTAAFALRVLGPDGLYYGDGCLTVADATLSMPAAIGPAGDYVLEWQVVSDDGHPVGDTIPFTWTGEATAEGTTTPASCGEAAPAPTPDATAPADDDASTFPLGTAVWIIVAVVAVGAAVTIALIATRRRS
ncbi:MAG: transporter [Leifsonia xyli]|nr:MAG: transporter [Leifsonia xyli]